MLLRRHARRERRLQRFRDLLGHAERFVDWTMRKGVWKDLEGDVVTQLDVARTTHFAHPTAANQRQDFVSAEAGAGAWDQDLFGVADYTEGTPSKSPGVSRLPCPHAKEGPEPLLFNT